MASRKKRGLTKMSGGGDAPWRAPVGEKPIPRISSPPILSIRSPPNFSYAVSIMRVSHSWNSSSSSSSFPLFSSSDYI